MRCVFTLVLGQNTLNALDVIRRPARDMQLREACFSPGVSLVGDRHVRLSGVRPSLLCSVVQQPMRAQCKLRPPTGLSSCVGCLWASSNTHAGR